MPAVAPEPTNQELAWPAGAMNPESTWYTWATNIYAGTGATSVTVPQAYTLTMSGGLWQPLNMLLGQRENPAIREERERRQREWEQQAQARRERAEQAHRRSLALLRTILNDAQWQDYAANSEFEVVGSSGARYRVERGSVGNVIALDDDGRPRIAYCAHPALFDAQRGAELPVNDVVAAQALALRTDDAAFIQIANVHQVWE